MATLIRRNDPILNPSPGTTPTVPKAQSPLIGSGAPLYSRNMVLTPGGVALPISKSSSNGWTEHYVQTGQTVREQQVAATLGSQANYRTDVDRLPTYFATNYFESGVGFVRTTTGNYIRTTGGASTITGGANQFNLQTSRPTLVLNEQEFKAAMSNPEFKALYTTNSKEADVALGFVAMQGLSKGLNSYTQLRKTEALAASNKVAQSNYANTREALGLSRTVSPVQNTGVAKSLNTYSTTNINKNAGSSAKSLTSSASGAINDFFKSKGWSF